MKKLMFVCTLSLLAAPALAGEPAKPAKAAQPDPAAGGMDMSKMGPWTRKPKNEKQIKKEINEFIKKGDELGKKGDFEGALTMHDFPVHMFTDDAKGKVEGDTWDKAKFTQMMKPMWENMPKDSKVTHKPTIVVLSDSMASITDDFVMTMGKQKFSGRNAGLLVKVDGQWKWKVMSEAGWGGMPDPSAHAPAKPAAKPAMKK